MEYNIDLMRVRFRFLYTVAEHRQPIVFIGLIAQEMGLVSVPSGSYGFISFRLWQNSTNAAHDIKQHRTAHAEKTLKIVLLERTPCIN